MDIRASRLGRDAAAALAVLTLYLLTLLIPLHQAQATQDRFDALGYENRSGWSLCIAGDYAPAQTEKLPNGCPFAGIGKLSIAPALLLAPDFGAIASFATIAYGAQIAGSIQRGETDAHPARAPPVVR